MADYAVITTALLKLMEFFGDGDEGDEPDADGEATRSWVAAVARHAGRLVGRLRHGASVAVDALRARLPSGSAPQPTGERPAEPDEAADESPDAES